MVFVSSRAQELCWGLWKVYVVAYPLPVYVDDTP